ncbi:MAG: hypothetical protein GY851_23220 [bacterium]|nr:hypothetical protein [bacterium]
MAEASDYDVVFLTDHGKVWPAHELAAAREFCDRVRIFPGIEITFPEGPDVLVLGADNPLYESLQSPSEVLAQACADGYLTILAHPYRWEGTLAPYCPLLDAVEVRSCNHPLQSQADRAEQYAIDHNMAQLFAGDAHGLNFLNRFWIETDETFETPQELRRLILAGRYENKMRAVKGPLPPSYKAATMAELAEDDLTALYVQPTA